MRTNHQILTTEQALAQIPHRSYDVAETILFGGMRGQGKTYGMRMRIEDREPRILMFDPFNDFRDVQAVSSIDEALWDMSYWPEACRRRIIPPIGDDSMDFAEDVFAKIIEGEYRLRNSVLALDEISLWSRFSASKRLTTLIRQGRRLGIKMLAASQRLADVPATLLSEVTEIVAFRFARPRDLEVLKNWSDEETVALCEGLSVGKCLLLQL